jgi:transcriptional regulator with XRE-family HTH domain
MFKNKFKARPVVETITVGDCLRRKREELGLDLEDLSKKLGIRPDYLEGLEKGDYALLPPPVYVRGFIKSYAGSLGMDAQQLVRIYNREISYVSEDEEGEKKKEKKTKQLVTWKERFSVTPRILTIGGSLCIMAVLGYYFMHQINSFNSKPYLFIESPSADEVVTEKELWISGKTEEDAILEINGQEISVGAEGRFSQKITLAEGRNLLVVEAKNRFDRTDRREINIVYEAPPAEKILVKELPSEETVSGDGVEFVEETPVDSPVKENLGSVLGANASAAGMEEDAEEEETAKEDVPLETGNGVQGVPAED